MWDILYRPRRYSDVLGQDASVRLLKTRVSKGTAFDTSYIFAGGYGQGKTTLGRIHAMAMLCQDLNTTDPEPCGRCDNCKLILCEQSEAFTERDAASNGSTEQMRSLVEELPYALPNAPKRIYLIDECQRMHPAAQDVLLKPIEEKRMVGMFCTTEVEKIRGAIRSRCEEYTLRKATREDVLPRMKMILNEQGVEHDDDAVLIVLSYANGHIRNAINNLEMVAQLGPVTIESVREYLNLSVVTLYYEILLNLHDPLRAIDLVGRACEVVAAEEVAQGIAEAAMNCYRVANNKGFADFAYVDKSLAEKVYNKYGDHVVLFCRWFLEHRSVSKLTLEVDVLAFSNNHGNLPPETGSPPVVFNVPGLPTALSVTDFSSSVRKADDVEVRPVAPVVPVAAPPPSVPAVSPCIEGDLEKWADPSPSSPLEKMRTTAQMPRQRSYEIETPIPKHKRPLAQMSVVKWLEAFELEYKKRRS